MQRGGPGAAGGDPIHRAVYVSQQEPRARSCSLAQPPRVSRQAAALAPSPRTPPRSFLPQGQMGRTSFRPPDLLVRAPVLARGGPDNAYAYGSGSANGAAPGSGGQGQETGHAGKISTAPQEDSADTGQEPPLPWKAVTVHQDDPSGGSAVVQAHISAAEWNSLLAWARPQRGPQWDAPTGMYVFACFLWSPGSPKKAICSESRLSHYRVDTDAYPQGTHSIRN